MHSLGPHFVLTYLTLLSPHPLEQAIIVTLSLAFSDSCCDLNNQAGC